MSPNGQKPGPKIVPSNNLYTVVLALACGVVFATTVYVAYVCYLQYETFLP